MPAKFFQRYHNHTDLIVLKKLFGWEDRKFDKDYLRNMNKRWAEWKSVQQIDETKRYDSRDKNLEEGVM